MPLRQSSLKKVGNTSSLQLLVLILRLAVLAQKSQKWIQMQNKRYGEKRKGGYVDMGKQVRSARRILSQLFDRVRRTCLPSIFAKSSRIMGT